VPIADAPRTAAGYTSDAGLYGAYMLDALEIVPALQWPESIRTYHAMRFDPRLTAVANAYTLPLRNACYAVDPAGCRDEVVQLIADDLGIGILGADDKPGPARRRGVDFDDYLRLALLHLIYGHSPFAIGGEVRSERGGPMRWRLNELAERLPNTISEIQKDTQGRLTGIVQYGETNAIPVNSLVWNAHEREGSNWQGRSMLRPAYGAWLLKHEMWRVLATGSRRFGAGTPVVTAPPGGTQAQVQEAQQLASAVRVGDQGGAGLPNGFSAKLMGIVGGVPDTLSFVRYLDQQMAEMALAGVLNLDASPNGSRALGETMIGLLQLSWGATAREITTPLTSLSIRMVDWNWGEDEAAPRIIATDISRPEVTVEAIIGLIGAGAIVPDPTLEAWMRERYSMPEADPVAEPATDPTVAPPAVEDDPETVTARNVSEIAARLETATSGKLISAEEGRVLLNRAGADLDGDAPVAPVPPAFDPAPPADDPAPPEPDGVPADQVTAGAPS
jgi:hypothetical protein